MELKQKAITGVKWVSFATAANNGLQFLLVVILARYLSKTDFGLMALVQVVIEFSSYFIDMGFSNIIIHKQDISHRQLSSLYWLNVITGIVIFLIIISVSPFIAGFYKSPELRPLLNIVAVTFVIIPFGQQHKTLFQKELKFEVISKIEVLSRSISIITAIYMGIVGFRVYSLAAMVIINSLTSTGLLLYAGLKNHKPGFIISHKELKGLYSFGIFQLGERTLNYFSGQIDTLLIGKLLGTQALGIYTVAKNLVMKPQQIINPIITRVSFPAMAKVQNDIPLLRRTYISTTSYLASINFPVHMAIIILAEPLIYYLFGPNWNAAIILVRILAVFAMLRSVFNPIGSLLLAKGRADLGFYWVIFFTLITIPTIYIGGLMGLIDVCYAQVILMLITFFPFYVILIKPLIKAKIWEYHSAILRPMLLSTAACIVPFLLSVCFHNFIVKITFVSLTGLIIYYLLSIRFNKEFISLMRNFMKL